MDAIRRSWVRAICKIVERTNPPLFGRNVEVPGYEYCLRRAKNGLPDCSYAVCLLRYSTAIK